MFKQPTIYDLLIDRYSDFTDVELRRILYKFTLTNKPSLVSPSDTIKYTLQSQESSLYYPEQQRTKYPPTLSPQYVSPVELVKRNILRPAQSNYISMYYGIPAIWDLLDRIRDRGSPIETMSFNENLMLAKQNTLKNIVSQKNVNAYLSGKNNDGIDESAPNSPYAMIKTALDNDDKIRESKLQKVPVKDGIYATIDNYLKINNEYINIGKFKTQHRDTAPLVVEFEGILLPTVPEFFYVKLDAFRDVNAKIQTQQKKPSLFDKAKRVFNTPDDIEYIINIDDTGVDEIIANIDKYIPKGGNPRRRTRRSKTTKRRRTSRKRRI